MYFNEARRCSRPGSREQTLKVQELQEGDVVRSWLFKVRTLYCCSQKRFEKVVLHNDENDIEQNTYIVVVSIKSETITNKKKNLFLRNFLWKDN